MGIMHKDNFKEAVEQIKVNEESINKIRKNLKELKNGGNSMNNMKRGILALACCAVIVFGVIYAGKVSEQRIQYPVIDNPEKIAALPRVESLEKLKELIKAENGDMLEGGMFLTESLDSAAPQSESMRAAQGATNEEKTAKEYSATNVQVNGVDEADIVKTDGKYIYYVSNSKVVIVDAGDPNDLKIVSEIKYSNNEKESFTPQELYISENRLVVIGNKYVYNDIDMNSPSRRMMPYVYSQSYTVAICYDTTNKTDIKHLRNVEIEGYYTSSRMIDNNIYMISNKSIYPYYIINDQMDPRPLYKDTAVSLECIAIDYKEMYYFPESESNNYLIIAGFPINNNEKADIQTYLGAGSTIYSSEENLYIVRAKYNYSEYIDGVMDRIMPATYEINTEIYKFSLQKGKTEFKCKAEVPGSVLNQFSMDENNGYFRIATNKTMDWESRNSENNLYILDKDLKVTGILEGLAKGERIYSVRFMGNRAYIVTFKQTDPLFVIDVSDPNTPKVLGELKIPGFSEYLHPYSENLLIGIGQDAETIKDYYGERTITTGMKMALFDVSDANNPKELFATKIGGRGTYSEVLSNHKAFLFSKEKDIMAFPITVTEDNSASNPMNYGKLTFQGAIVYGVDLQKGFVEKGRISHVNLENNSRYFNYDYGKEVERIIYIGDTLFTVSKGLIKAVNMNDMKEKTSLEIKIEEDMGYMPYVIAE